MIQSISDEDFNRLTHFIKTQYGITLQEKRQLVTSRLSSLVSEQGYTSFTPFITQLLKERDPQKIELVLNRLTTNYTFFMRETEHFDFFTKVILPELVHKYEKKKSIAIWSAGCSTGCWPPTSPSRPWPRPRRASMRCPTRCPSPGAGNISKRWRAAGTLSPLTSATT